MWFNVKIKTRKKRIDWEHLNGWCLCMRLPPLSPIVCLSSFRFRINKIRYEQMCILDFSSVRSHTMKCFAFVICSSANRKGIQFALSMNQFLILRDHALNWRQAKFTLENAMNYLGWEKKFLLCFIFSNKNAIFLTYISWMSWRRVKKNLLKLARLRAFTTYHISTVNIYT